MPTRADLIAALEAHLPFDAQEAAMLARVLAFVRAEELCFERTLLAGHVTASAWVVDPALSQTLLVRHAKLHRWLQPGGHCDGDPGVLANALREVCEETGLTRITPLLDGRIFDVDAHDIPARGAEPAHVHYDIRFLVQADPSEPLQLSDESHALAWVRLEDVASLDTDASVLRLAARTRALGRSR